MWKKTLLTFSFCVEQEDLIVVICQEELLRVGNPFTGLR